MNRFLRLLLPLTLLCVLASCIRDDEETELVRLGDQLPRFTVVLNDGRTYDSGVRDGRGSVIVFFSTTCSDCQRELPVLDSLYRAGRYADSHVVCISRAEGEDVVGRYWEEHHFALPYSAQPDRRVFDLFATMGIPRIYTADARGCVTDIAFSLHD